MPRLANSVPRYRLHRASRQAITTINGRTFYLGLHGSKASRVEYDRLITEWLTSGRSSSYGVPEHVVTVVEVVVAYLEHAKSYYGDGSRSEFANMRHALKPLRTLYGRTPAREFTPQKLKVVREKFIALGWSRKHINQNVQRIGRMFRWAVGEGLVGPEIPQALAMLPGLRKGKTTAPEGRKVRPANDKLVDATLPLLSPIVRSMVELQRATGARPGEVVLIRPCDVDRSSDVWEFRPATHKNAHREQDRVIYLGPAGQHVLRPYLLRDAESYCFVPAEAVAKQREARHTARQTPIKYGNRPGSNRRRKPKRQAGERYTTQSYLSAVRRACDKAFPIPDAIADDPAAVAKWYAEHRWSPNQLRHGMATRVRREFGLESAKVLLGHSQLNTTGIYAEQDRQRAIEVAKRIG
jgi:integrase